MESMERVLTGIRPTGRLHLGHFVGALNQWIPLQDEYECFFLIADVQALTTHADDPTLIARSVREVVLDFLSVGLFPNRPNVHFVLQSGIPELYELTVLLSMVTPDNWVSRNPTVMAEKASAVGDVTVGFAMYPVSQAADILFVTQSPNQAILVPVGEDQIPHLRLNNKIAARFNRIYAPVLARCEPLVGKIGRLVGIDGEAKMSKSLGNVINLSDPTETVRRQVMRMFTDPNRTSADVPGAVEGNPVFMYHDAFNRDVAQVADLKKRYRAGKVGDVEVKHALIDALEEFLQPIRERRMMYQENASLCAQFLEEGTAVARKVAQNTLTQVRHAMGLDYQGLF